jgi:homoserine dehydrogenase
MIPRTHQLVAVSGAMNAVYAVGEPLSRGEQPLPGSVPYGRVLTVCRIEELKNRFYLRVRINDEVGTLAPARTSPRF